MYNFKNKVGNIQKLNLSMLIKTASMFEYENLPDTIPAFELEKILQQKGHAVIAKVNNDLYALSGGFGGLQDAYGNSKQYVVSNVGLNFNRTLDIGEDCVLIKSDDYMMGLFHIFDRYNTYIVENDINIMLHGYNTRTQKLISASDDKTKASAELLVKKSIDGDIAVIGENGMFEGVKLHSVPSSQTGGINGLIELQQYLKGSMFNEIGLSANFNMKRERLVSDEVSQGEDSLLVLVYNMLKCRIEAIEKINEKFNTDIKIKLGSVWCVKDAEQVADATPITNNVNVNEDIINGNPTGQQTPTESNNGKPNNSGNPPTEQGTGEPIKTDTSADGNRVDSKVTLEKVEVIDQGLNLAEIEELLLDENLTQDEITYLNSLKNELTKKE